MVKNIILISPKFSECIGGMETHGVEFVNYFYNNKNFNLKSVLVNSNIQDGVKIKKHHENKKYNKIVKRVLTEDYNIDTKIISNEIVNENDILFLNSPTWLPIIPQIKTEFPKLKIIVRSGGNDIIAGWIGNENDMNKSLVESREEIVLLINKYVDILILNSNYTKIRCSEVGISNDKIIVLKGGVDTSRFAKENINNEKINILTTGRFVPFKGIEYSLKAIANLKKEIGTNFKYILVGDGPEKEKLKLLSKELDLLDIVEFKDAVDLETVHKYYNKSDIFLHMPIELEKTERGSSYIHTETMGRSICEALSSGLPIVTTKVGGISEMVDDNNNAFLVNSTNYIEASKKLYNLVTDNRLRYKMSINAQKVAQNNYDWKVIFNEYEKIFTNEN